MTITDVKDAVAVLHEYVDDPEVAHSKEDHLYFSVLQAIANGECKSPEGCAREAVRAATIDFPRWSA